MCPAAAADAAALLLALALAGAAPLGAQTASPAPGAGDDDPRAAALVDRWIEAAGGMEAFHRLESARYTLTTEIWDPESGRIQRTRPRYVSLLRAPEGELARVERWEGDDFIAHGWDGERAWARMNGRALGPGDQDFDEARYVASDVHYWIALPYKLRDPGVRLHHAGTDEAGRELVRVTFGEGVGDHQDVWHYLFEDGRAWPVEVRFVEEGQTGVNRLRFEDVREVDGYVFVGRRVHFDEDGGLTKVLDTKDFRYNPGVTRADLAAPPPSG